MKSTITFAIAAALALAATVAILPMELQAKDSPQWTNIGPGAPGVWANAAVDPAGNVYVGSVGGGVRKFTAADGTWSSASTGLNGTAVFSLAMDANDPATLYAGVFSLAADAPGGVFKTTNGGLTWSGPAPQTAGVIAMSMASDPHVTGVAFAGDFGGAMWRTTDGTTWSKVFSGMPTTPPAPVTSVVIDPSNSAVVYASTLAGCLKSTNGGEVGSWAPISGLPSEVWGLAIDPADDNTLYAATANGIWISREGGVSWQAAGALPPATIPYSFAVDSSPAHTIFASTSTGVWASSDNGSAWHQTSLADRLVVSIRIGPGGILYAGTMSGPAVSNDFGGTWTYPDPLEGGAQAFGYAITVDPNFGRKIFVSSLGSTAFVSDDGGKSWSTVGPTYTAREPRKIAVDPTDSSRVYSATLYSGLFKSVDGGATWSKRSIGSGTGNAYVWVPVVDPVSPNIVYAGTVGQGLFRSEDYGDSWTPIPGLPANVRGVTVDPRDDNEVFAATNRGIFRSHDRGLTWPDHVLSQGTWNITIAGGNSSIVYAETISAGVYRSDDGGATWAPKNIGITNLTMGRAAPVLIDPDYPQVLYVGSEGGGGVYRSINGGDSWSAMNFGLSDTSVFGLAQDPHRSGTLYVSGPHGVFMISGAAE